ncbi:MAG: BLUF domain-containing protein [Verrucomicrobiota bacterium]|nr:BLUF domain-containing protein [Verrucomicrobiota bacterium]
MQLYSLIYVSIATDELGSEGLLEILRASRENNIRDDITGLLLYKDRRFMQLLEGPETAVCATFARIARDMRHHDVTILLEEKAEERDFPDWSRGFQALEDEAVRATPGFSGGCKLKAPRRPADAHREVAALPRSGRDARSVWTATISRSSSAQIKGLASKSLGNWRGETTAFFSGRATRSRSCCGGETQRGRQCHIH